MRWCAIPGRPAKLHPKARVIIGDVTRPDTLSEAVDGGVRNVLRALSGLASFEKMPLLL